MFKNDFLFTLDVHMLILILSKLLDFNIRKFKLLILDNHIPSIKAIYQGNTSQIIHFETINENVIEIKTM